MAETHGVQQRKHQHGGKVAASSLHATTGVESWRQCRRKFYYVISKIPSDAIKSGILLLSKKVPER